MGGIKHAYDDVNDFYYVDKCDLIKEEKNG